MFQKYRIEIKWAGIFILMTITWMFIEKLTGLHDQYISRHAAYTNLIAIPAVLIYVCCLLEKRKKVLNNEMSWSQGFSSGMLMTAIVAACAPLTQYIVLNFITPHYFENMIKLVIDKHIMSPEQAAAYFTLPMYIVNSIFGTIIMGMVIVPLVALFTQKKKKSNA